MLDAYIIDSIRRQEEERRRRDEEGRRIQLELPVYRDERRRPEVHDEDADRGPIVIPFGPSNDPDPAEEDAA